MHPLIFIPATILLVVRSWRRESLTPLGIISAALTATIHGLHPSSVPFTLLVVFFLLGTSATKVKHEIKATLTISSSGSGGGEGPRSAIQVLANSGVASALVLLQLYLYGTEHDRQYLKDFACFGSFNSFSEFLLLGIIANYAAVTADTLSSELGILSKSRPRLITSLREVPPGTNGGVTFAGLAAGFCGSLIIGVVATALLPFCVELPMQRGRFQQSQNHFFLSRDRGSFVTLVAVWGTLGSLLDSFLGSILQASVVDRRTGKVVEGTGGVKVKTTGSQQSPLSKAHETGQKVLDKTTNSRFIDSGRDILDNNQINVLMAFLMSFGAVGGFYVLKNGM